MFQQWNMRVKYHSTGLTYMASLTHNKAKSVAHEHNHIFDLIGYPTIFHTDNRKNLAEK